MGVLRAAVTAVLMLATAVSAAGQCLSEARVISTHRSVPNLVAGPVAWGHDVLAVAKTEAFTGRIFVGTYDHDFEVLTGDILITSDSADGPLALVFNGTDFGLFYRTDESEQLFLQRISLTGDPVASPSPISTRNIDNHEEVDVAWSDTLDAYVVATTFETRGQHQVWVTVIGRDGIVQRDIHTFVFAAADEASLNVAVTDDGTIGVFLRTGGDHSIGFVRITRNGGVFPDTIWTPGFDLKVIALGNRFYLVKSIEFSIGQRDIRWLVVDSAGNIVKPDGVLLHANDLDLRPAALATNGEELALSYFEDQPGFVSANANFRLHRFTPAGAVLGDTLFAAANPVQRFATSAHDIVSTGRAYITTAVRERDRELNSLLIRYCLLRAAINVDRHQFTTSDQVTFTAAVDGGVPGYSYFWNPGDTVNVFHGPALNYRYARNGTYRVTLTVVDANGVSTTTTTEVRVVSRKKRAVRK